MQGASRATEKQQASGGIRSFNSAISRSASDSSSGCVSFGFTRSTFRPNRVMTFVLSSGLFAGVYGVHFGAEKARHRRDAEVGSNRKGKRLGPGHGSCHHHG